MRRRSGASQLGAYWLGLAIAAVITALLIESVGVVTDRAGMVALCPMSFAAVGAWTLGYLNAHNWPGEFLLWLVAGGVVAVPVGLLVGMPALRLRGVQLAVITLSFAAVTDSVFTYWGFPGQLAGAYVNRPGRDRLGPGLLRALLDHLGRRFQAGWPARRPTSDRLRTGGRSRGPNAPPRRWG